MTISHIEKLGSSSRVRVSWAEGVVRLRDDELFGERLGNRCLFFLRHVFTLREVAWVEVDRNLATASIHYDAHCFGLPEFLQRLATAIRGPLAPHAEAASRCLERDLTHASGRVRIQRFGAILTTWDIIHDRPGRIRLRHQTIYRNAALANRLRAVIENLAGVIECAVWPITGSVLIRFDPDLTSAACLLQVLDHVKYTCIARAGVSHSEAGWFWASQLIPGTGSRWRDGSPVIAAGLRYPLGRLESQHILRRRTAGPSRAIWTAGSLYEHRRSDVGQWPIHRIGGNELDAHLLDTPVS